MSLLVISPAQGAMVSALDALLQDAFSAGVVDGVPLLPLVPNYASLGPAQQAAVKLAFEALFAAILSECNIQAPLPNPVTGTVTVPLAKLTADGSNGSLTFQGGILTAYSAPN